LIEEGELPVEDVCSGSFFRNSLLIEELRLESVGFTRSEVVLKDPVVGWCCETF
jgi:hypothetical protein